VKATGTEFEVQTEWPGHLRTRVAHVLQSARDSLTELRISNSPEQVATLVLDAPVGRTGLFAAFNAYYLGERLSVHDTTIGAAFVADLTLSRASVRGLGLALSLHNLFDTAYGHPGSVEHRQRVIMQDGRTVGVRATYRF
jgi:outer membrane receptor protein involved in Fe transport